jgi:hypothetical protein
MHYKIIFLIISSQNNEIYLKMRYLLSKFYCIYPNEIKYFFVENKENLDQDVIEDNNYLYIKGIESYVPGIYQKTINAMEYVTNKYSFDYLIRTNLSTFWHLPNLFNFLNNIPKEKFAGGFNIQGFLTGTGIIMSRDVAITVYTYKNYSHISEDLAFSQTIQANGISLFNITDYKWGFLIPKNDILPNNCRYLDINDNFSDILFFRIKNSDRNIDITYFEILLNKIYNIDCDVTNNITDKNMIDKNMIDNNLINTNITDNNLINTNITDNNLIVNITYNRLKKNQIKNNYLLKKINIK